jgi:CheY-like chemotaxis protein
MDYLDPTKQQGTSVMNNAAVRPCQVFLIEDDLDDQILAKRELEACSRVSGVISFPDGQALLAYMKEKGFMDHSVLALTPILMLVDLEMPKKDGLEVIKELKSDPFLESIPLIVITGTKSPEKIESARALGANGVFRKPVRKSILDRFFQDAWKWPPEEMWMQ